MLQEGLARRMAEEQIKIAGGGGDERNYSGRGYQVTNEDLLENG